MTQMAKFGITVEPSINKQQKIQGFRFIHEATGVNIKASEVDRKLRLNELFAGNAKETSYSRPNEQQFTNYKRNPSVWANILEGLKGFDMGGADDDVQRKRNKKRKGGLTR